MAHYETGPSEPGEPFLQCDTAAKSFVQARVLYLNAARTTSNS